MSLAVAQELQRSSTLQFGFAPERLERRTEVYKEYVDRGDLPGALAGFEPRLLIRLDAVIIVRAVMPFGALHLCHPTEHR